MRGAKMQGYTRRSVLTGLVGGAVGLLAACASATKPVGQATVTTTAARSSAAKPASGHLGVWHASAGASIDGKALDKLLAGFQQQFPAIQPEHLVAVGQGSDNFAKLTASIAGGAPPDVLSIDVIWPAALVAKQAVRPLDSYLDAKRVTADGPRLDDYFPGPLDACTIDRKTYALPYETSNLFLYYNADLFKANGIDPTKALATWDTFRATAVRLTKRTGATFDQMGFLIPRASLEWRLYTWAMYLWQAGGDFVNGAGTQDTFNQAPGVEAAQFWTDLVHKDQVTALKQPGGLFKAGKAAMYIQGPGDIVGLQKAKLQFAFGTAVMPKQKVAASDTGGWNWSIAAESKNPDAAWTWLEWSGRTPQLVTWSLDSGQLPPRKSARDAQQWKQRVATDAVWQAPLDTLSIQRTRPKLAKYTDWSPIVSQGLEQAVSGAATPKQALDQAARQADAVLKS